MNVDKYPLDIDEYRTAGMESDRHLWAKAEFDRRRQNRDDPEFDGEYRFERKVADRVPDVHILSPTLNRWIEFVDGSDQEYRAKTREALRLGFVIHWVIHIDRGDQRAGARRALDEELRGPFTFGTFDEKARMLDLGDPITYRNFDFPVQSMDEFHVDDILGYRSGSAGIRSVDGVGFEMGVFDLAGYQCRIEVLGRDGELFRAAPVGETSEKTPWGFPSVNGVERLVDAGKVTRLGPVG